MDLLNFLSAAYWFNIPGAQGVIFTVITVIFAILFLAGIALRFVKATSQNKAFKKEIGTIIGTLVTFGIIGLIFCFFRYEDVTFFSARFWMLLVMILTVVFMIRAYKKYMNNYNRRLDNAKRYAAK